MNTSQSEYRPYNLKQAMVQSLETSLYHNQNETISKNNRGRLLILY